jgi:hypothetical protein
MRSGTARAIAGQRRSARFDPGAGLIPRNIACAFRWRADAPSLPTRRRWAASAHPKETEMTDTKYWWQSRTMWVNLVAALFAMLGAFGLLPASIDQDSAVSAIMGAVAIANVVLRLVTRHAIA